VNRPPVLGNLSATTVQDVPVTLNLLDGASDPDHDPMTVVEAHVGDTGSVSTSFVELHSDHRTVTVTPGPVSPARSPFSIPSKTWPSISCTEPRS
jgi:hypothetical protein